jgi:hypothetical protein
VARTPEPSRGVSESTLPGVAAIVRDPSIQLGLELMDGGGQLPRGRSNFAVAHDNIDLDAARARARGVWTPGVLTR